MVHKSVLQTEYYWLLATAGRSANAINYNYITKDLDFAADFRVRKLAINFDAIDVWIIYIFHVPPTNCSYLHEIWPGALANKQETAEFSSLRYRTLLQYYEYGQQLNINFHKLHHQSWRIRWKLTKLNWEEEIINRDLRLQLGRYIELSSFKQTYNMSVWHY